MTMTISTRKGEKILVDDADYAELSKFLWRVDSQGYARSSIKDPCHPRKQREVNMHRQIIGLNAGDKFYVDHINGDKLDNRRANLRVCSNAENGWNTGMWVTNKSGFKGVRLEARSGRWLARIRVNGNIHDLGSFECPHEAAHAYNKAAIQHRGEFAVLNPVGV